MKRDDSLASPQSKPLLSWIWQSYARTALIPLLCVEIALIATYMGTNAYIRHENIATIRKSAQEDLSRISHQQAAILDNRLNGLGETVSLLAKETERAFQTPFTPDTAEKERYTTSPGGSWYTQKDIGRAAAFYSGHTPIGPQEQEKALRLSQIDPVLKNIVETHNQVLQAYINTNDSLNRIYPYFDVISQYAEKMDIPSYNFYYEADAAHNPNRGPVWTDVYVDPAGGSWTVSAIAPSYVNGKLEAVAGLDVSIATLLRELSQLNIPWNGYAVLLNRNGVILTLPPRGEKDFGLNELTTYTYSDAIKADTFKPDDFDISRRAQTRALGEAVKANGQGLLTVELGSPYLVSWATVPSTGWKLLVLSPQQEIFRHAEYMKQRFDRVGYAIIAGLVFFYMIFFYFLYDRSRHMALRIADPLKAIQALTARIGSGSYKEKPLHFEVSELDRMAQSVAEMGQQLGDSAERLESSNAQLEEQILFQQALLQTMPIAVFYRGRDGGYQGCNPVFEELVGMKEAEVIGKKPMEVFGSTALRHVDLDVQDARVQQGETVHMDFTMTHPNTKQPIELSVYKAGFRDRQGNVRGVVGVAIDMTAERRAAEALREAKEKAEAADRSKSEFLANMSHELRTPLNAIIGYAEMLSEDAKEQGNNDCLPDLQKIHASGKHLLELINGILDLSKIEAGKMDLYLETVTVQNLIDEVVAMTQPLATHNHNTFTAHIQPDLGNIYIDPTKLKQVMMNLLSNACKFTSDGHIDLHISREVGQAEGVLAPPEILKIIVKDNGIGMDKEQITRLFTRFTQADSSTARKYGGTGLGLAISRHFVEMMGGRIDVDSALKQGTAFTVTVPCHVEELPTDIRQKTTAIRHSVPSGKKILVIDDDALVHRYTDTILEPLQAQILHAHGGQEGLNIALSQEPDVIILDVLMADRDGWSVLKSLKEHPTARNIPVVLMTEVGDPAMAYSLGASTFLSKPVAPQTILDAVAGCLDRTVATEAPDILIVDDDQMARDVLRRTLERAGFSVAEAVDGDVALERVGRQRPLVMLLDLAMPNTNGFDVIDAVRADSRLVDLPIIVVTAQDLTKSQNEWLKERVTIVLRKGTYHRADLVRLVQERLSKKLPLATEITPAAQERGAETS